MSLASFKNEFGLAHKTSKEFAAISANIVSTYQGGCFFGSLLGYPLGQILGRRLGLLISAIVFVLGAGVVSGDLRLEHPPATDLLSIRRCSLLTVHADWDPSTAVASSPVSVSVPPLT